LIAVSSIWPEECGVVGLAAEDLFIDEVGRHSADGLYCLRDCLRPMTGSSLSRLFGTTFSAR
jgi:hypothetical protein